MRSVRKQIAVLSVFMVLIIAALTLGGLQLFGNGKVKPSEWFKKADKPQVEQTVPEAGNEQDANVAASVMRSALLSVGSNDGIMTLSESDVLCEHTNHGDSFQFERALHSYVTVNLYRSSDYFSTDFYVVGSDALLFSLPNSYMSFYYGDYAQGGYTYFANYITICCHNFLGQVVSAVENFDPSTTTFDFDNISSYLESGNLYKNINYDEDNDVLTMTFCDSSSQRHNEIQQSGRYEKFYVNVLYQLPPTPEKDGHVFDGWFYGSESDCDGNCVFYGGETLYEDTELHAHFQINTYTVTFDSNGGDFVSEQVVDWNTAVELPDCTKEDYTLIGWFYEDGTEYMGQPITEDVTLVAQWQQTTFTVYFDSNGGEDVSEQKYDMGASITDLPTLTKVGCDFLGWYYEDGTEYTGQPITEDMTLAARWKIHKITVTFMVEGETQKTVEVFYGTTLVSAMRQANLVLYQAVSADGVRLSKQNSVITEDVQVLVHELTAEEKIGDFIGQHVWVLWSLIGFVGALAIMAGISIAVAVKRK